MSKPGAYVADVTEGITDPARLPQAAVQNRSRSRRQAPCPRCGKRCYRDSEGERTLHDLGSLRSNRPVDLQVSYSKHRCEACKIYFNNDMSGLAPPGAHYTQRVIQVAVRVVLEDGLPYREACWHMWRDHRVFIPFATIQNWVEAAGEKRKTTSGARPFALGASRLLRIHRR